MVTYTYSGDPINVPLDEIRMLLTDTGTSDNTTTGAPPNSKFGCLVSDEVINYHLYKIPNNVYRVAQTVLALVVSGLQGGNQRYKTLLSQRTGDMQESYGDSAKDAMYVVEKLIADLKSQELAMMGFDSSGPYVGVDEYFSGMDSIKIQEIVSD